MAGLESDHCFYVYTSPSVYLLWNPKMETELSSEVYRGVPHHIPYESNISSIMFEVELGMS
jgi:hypothetical protein